MSRLTSLLCGGANRHGDEREGQQNRGAHAQELCLQLRRSTGQRAVVHDAPVLQAEVQHLFPYLTIPRAATRTFSTLPSALRR